MGLGKYNALAWMLYITLAQVLKLFLVVYNALARALELLPAAGAVPGLTTIGPRGVLRTTRRASACEIYVPHPL